MKFSPTDIQDIVIIEPRVFNDERGFFKETFQAKVFAQVGITDSFVQDNLSGSRQGTLRGLHYQIKQAQGKLIQVLSGEIFDAAVDLRKRSDTFGKWVGKILSRQNNKLLWIPPGFAHGYYVLSDWADVAYKVTDFYAPEWERTILWDDPTIGIEWPLKENTPLLISPKDAAGIPFPSAEVFEEII